MMSVWNSIFIRGDLPTVFQCFWEADLWPRLNSPVRRIEMLQSSARYQRFVMGVAAGNRAYMVETEREGVPHESITYRQLRPPPLFEQHTGEWRFRADRNGVR